MARLHVDKVHRFDRLDRKWPILGSGCSGSIRRANRARNAEPYLLSAASPRAKCRAEASTRTRSNTFLWFQPSRRHGATLHSTFDLPAILPVLLHKKHRHPPLPIGVYSRAAGARIKLLPSLVGSEITLPADKDLTWVIVDDISLKGSSKSAAHTARYQEFLRLTATLRSDLSAQLASWAWARLRAAHAGRT